MFALVDCNNFFVSCERVFNPKLLGRPCVVLSNNDGCVISRSQEAKDLGIPMGAPVFKWREVLEKHRVATYSTNFPLYGDMSKRVRNTLAQLNPELEVYSIDEVFLSLDKFNSSDLIAYGETIVKTVQQNTGIPVSVGIAQTKTLAKAANFLAKKSKKFVFEIKNGEIDQVLDSIAVGEVWGIGRQLEKFLISRGISTARKLKDSPEAWIKKHLHLPGLRIVRELSGTRCLSFEEQTPRKKSICCSRTFGKSVEDLSTLSEAVASYVSLASEKLRKENSIAGEITVFLRTNRHRLDLPQYQNSVVKILLESTANTLTLNSHALDALREIYKSGYSYKRAGVWLSKISSNQSSQLGLFQNNNYEKEKTLMQVMDAINAYWGRNTLKIASTGIQKKSLYRQKNLSPRYTTCWNEIPVVKA
jgi:DNA polymerase V